MYGERIKKIVVAIGVTGIILSFAAGLTGGVIREMVFGNGMTDMMASMQDMVYYRNAAIAVVLISGTVFLVLLVLLNRAVCGYNSDSLLRCNMAQTLQLEKMKETVSFLQDAYALKEKKNKAKSNFLNRMSHDLRTPMNAIVGYSMLMERVSEDPERVSDYAQKITMSGRTLLELINDVLDMSCIEAGNIKLIQHKFSLRSAIDEVNSAIKPQIENKRQAYRFYMTNSADRDLVTGDKQRLCQILRNILSNAVKYTAEGGNIEFDVNIIDGGNGNLQLLCRIRDNGCGMSREFQKSIFDPFARENNERNTSVPGTGLGMSIVKCFTELMNGTVSIESELNNGTMVTVMIPFKAAVEEKVGIKCVFDNEEVLRGLRILAAEDNESNAEILQEVLTAMGAECVIASDGQEAAELFEESGEGEYDMILMDIQMPVMNGYQAAAAIRKSRHPGAKDIVIIAMTADAFEEDVQKAFVSGMNAHVAKPLDLQAFINTVKSLNIGKW